MKHLDEKDTGALLRAALENHSRYCEECGGPGDGCEFGQGLEHLMLWACDSAYELKPGERTAPLSQHVISIMSGRA